MKKLLLIITILSMSLSLLHGNNPTKDKSNHIKEIVVAKNYTFTANTAIPMQGRTRYLNYSYSLRVKKDTIVADLPYFGRIYTAPSDPTDIGFNFKSIKNSYTAKEKKNGWDISIQTIDTKTKYSLTLSIGLSGYSTLMITENDRQPITFYGEIY